MEPFVTNVNSWNWLVLLQRAESFIQSLADIFTNIIRCIFLILVTTQKSPGASFKSDLATTGLDQESLQYDWNTLTY